MFVWADVFGPLAPEFVQQEEFYPLCASARHGPRPNLQAWLAAICISTGIPLPDIPAHIRQVFREGQIVEEEHQGQRQVGIIAAMVYQKQQLLRRSVIIGEFSLL